MGWVKINKKKIKYLSIFFCMIVAIAIIYFIDPGFNTDGAYASSYEHSKGWHVEINDENYDNVDLKNFKFDPLQKGDTMIMTSILPDIKYNNAMVRFLVYHATIDMYVDNELIYTFGQERYKTGKVVGYGYHYINLPSDYCGRELRIEMIISEEDAFSSIDPLLLDTTTNSYLNYLKYNMWSIFICIFIFVSGIIIFVICLVMILLKQDMKQLLWISIAAISAGIWCMCNEKILQLWSQNLVLNQALEFFSLYLIPIPFIMYSRTIKKNSKHEQRILGILVIVNILFNVMVLILQMTGITHYSNLLDIYHVLLAIDLACLLFSYLYKFTKRSSEEKIIVGGLLICAIMILIQLVCFNLDKYFKIEIGFHFNSLAVFGFMLLILSLIISYCKGIEQMAYKEAEAQFLSEVAYTDYLTKINNRAKCHDIFTEFMQTKIPYAVVSFDINNFKPVNDNFGHGVGDQLLIEFAQILKNNFDKFGHVGRIGGDEFIAILANMDENQIKTLLEKMHTDITNLPKNKLKGATISVAYGIAFTSEIVDKEFCSAEVCALADKRMYIMKSSMK